MPSSTFFGMQHLNANILCAIHLEMTGPDATFHEPLEVAILPLDSMLKVHPTLPIFNMRIKPQEMENVEREHIRMTNEQLARTMLSGMDRYQVADLLKDWHKSLPLGLGKKILPLSYDYPKQREGLISWLGFEEYDEMFSESYRDILVATHFVNDYNCVSNDPIPFAKQFFPWICRKLNVERVDKTPLGECVAYGETYKRLLQVL